MQAAHRGAVIEVRPRQVGHGSEVLVAYAMKLAKTMQPGQSILVNLSGRGDKDLGTVADLAGADFYDRPSMRGLQVKGASK